MIIMALQESNYKGFIPTIWSARLLNHLDNKLVALNLVNREYEGDISSYGDTVKINSIGPVTIKEYTGADIDAPEELTAVQQELKIDQGRYFNFHVKDVDQAQANVALLDAATQRAAYDMADHIDKDVFTVMANKAEIKVGTASAPLDVTSEDVDIYNVIADVSAQMDAENVPSSGRVLVVPAFVIAALNKHPLFNRNDNVVANGFSGTILGIQIYVSNNLKSTATYVAGVLGLPEATAFANQVVETEAYRPERNFSDAVKGLQVYGRSVIEPNKLAVVYFKKPGAGVGA